ncbi:MAG: hypothetical protein KGL39_59280 [Patescibacteria group bacterium]|nr:hypothetical protein [Patescibacteria group bacterium]
MNEMTYELNQMHERAAVTECLAAVTITNENGRHVPTVIIVPDSLAEAQQEKVREHLWGIAEIMRNAHEARSDMANVILNEQRFFDGWLEKMNAQFREAAEPIVKQAVADAEAAIRAQLGQTVVGLLEHNFSVVRDGHELRITVRHDAPPNG